jgi:hypothetical protein
MQAAVAVERSVSGVIFSARDCLLVGQASGICAMNIES